MNRNPNQPKPKPNVGIDLAEIENILAAEDHLVPSSGFLASVMERVQEEATAPAPIPFPWKRAVPGILLATGVLGWGAVELLRAGFAATKDASLPALHLPNSLVLPIEDAGWVALALAISLVATLFSRRLAGRSGLL